MTQQRVYVLGGTGNVGTKAVQDLVSHGVSVTLFARDPAKVKSMFASHAHLVNVVQGDYQDLTPIKETIRGHDRLLLSIFDNDRPAEIKGTIAKYAYDAGVKQIVNISTLHISFGYRNGFIPAGQLDAENAMMAIPGRGRLVSLRPGHFMSNLFMSHISAQGALYEDSEPEELLGMISPNDIGAVAAVVLQEDVEKHKDSVYNMIGDIVTPNEMAATLSRILGREIPFRKIYPVEKYHMLIKVGVPHTVAVDIVDNFKLGIKPSINPIIEILLGRKPQTLEEYLSINKDRI
ncbi:hypothetical protein CU098_003547 [Rhizopus stolonifer]|uniref:NAD(P)-binding domain-containing protein n=1 Tax=Rhizopus stolonifer TaxID=4846 RepID=A0A367J0Q8_RHIST|nr:hypothetical protein CU098_003547 [Rhizopus stolonifer]